MTVVSDTRAILADYVWNSRPLALPTPAFISYSFEDRPLAEIPPHDDHGDAFDASFRPLNEIQRAAARAAFSIWDRASGITFFEVPAGMGGIKLAGYDLSFDPELSDAGAVFAGRFSPTGYAPKTVILVDPRPDPSDVQLYLHEIGHGIGLKHPFEGDFTLPYALDDTDTTVMSYYRGANRTGLGWMDRQAVAQRYGGDDQDGRQVADWRWDQATATLHQTGRASAERITGIGGHNVIRGQGGDDVVEGADGHDLLFGGEGDDSLYGHGGNDHLYGRAAEGGADGADLLSGGGGSDYLQGNAGADTLEGGTGSDRMFGGQGGDLMLGQDGNDSANGNLGNDTIEGGGGNDSLRGGQGDDGLAGGAGDDTLLGDLGDDIVSGGTGIDLMTGGAGSDRFAFDRGDAACRADGGIDAILDFASGTDRIVLGFSVAVVLAGAAGDHLAAAGAAQRLMGERAGDGEVAAIAVGADRLLFFSAGGGATMDAAIRLVGIGETVLSIADFG